MMKKAVLAISILLLISILATPVYCDDAVKKLGRGICNVVTFPFEIPYQVQRTNNNEGPMAALTYGILKGAGMACARAGIGVYEVVTFPFPLPKNYRPILTDPEFFFEDKSW